MNIKLKFTFYLKNITIDFVDTTSCQLQMKMQESRRLPQIFEQKGTTSTLYTSFYKTRTGLCLKYVYVVHPINHRWR